MRTIPNACVSVVLAGGFVVACSSTASTMSGDGSDAARSSSASGSSGASAWSGSSSTSSSSGVSSGVDASEPMVEGGEDDASKLDSEAASGDDGARVEAGEVSGDGGWGTPTTKGAPLGWYEAEDVPPNTTCTPGPYACKVVRGTAVCPALPPKPGDACNSNGGEMSWIVSAASGFLQFNDIQVPADGTYDLTWFYHCGLSDNFGDTSCGGQTSPPTTPSGCRPHKLTVNGVALTGTYHFPCFPGSWAIEHVATTTVPLKAGTNTVRIGPPKPRDAADLDAVWVQRAGLGSMPLIAPMAM